MPKKGTTKPDSEMRARYRKMRINGKQVNVARYMLEQKIGRPLEKFEYVHHINGNKLDDRPENLALVSPKEHAHIHLVGRPLSAETKLRMSLSQKGKHFGPRGPNSAESNQRRSETMKKVRKNRFWSSKKTL